MSENCGGDHVWGPWEFEGPTTCTQVRFCRRCNSGRETQDGHEWSIWTKKMHSQFDMETRNCRRCRTYEERHIKTSLWDVFK